MRGSKLGKARKFLASPTDFFLRPTVKNEKSVRLMEVQILRSERAARRSLPPGKLLQEINELAMDREHTTNVLQVN